MFFYVQKRHILCYIFAVLYDKVEDLHTEAFWISSIGVKGKSVAAKGACAHISCTI